MQIMPDIEKLKRWREERCWSQEHLADLAGISLRTVQRIENGETASRDSIMALAAAYNVDVTSLTVDPRKQAEAILAAKQHDGIAALRLSVLIHFACYLFGMLIFAGISLGAKDGSYAMLWPSIWWTVGMAGHALALALALIVQRFGKSGV